MNVNYVLRFAVTLFVPMLMACSGLAAEAEIRLIPGVPLLFADDTVIEERKGLVRIVHEGRPDKNPVIGKAEPWERSIPRRTVLATGCGTVASMAVFWWPTRPMA